MSRSAKDPTTGVTVQQERFAFEMATTGRPSVAYRRAYNAGAMGDASVAVNANQLLSDTKIALRVEHYRKIAEAKLGVSVERIALELARIAFFDLGKLVDADGCAIPLHELDEDTRRALNGMDIKVVKDGAGIGHVKKYRHVPKIEALRVLAQWQKMLIDRTEVGRPGAFDQLSDAELQAHIAAEAAALEAISKAKLRLQSKVKTQA